MNVICDTCKLTLTVRDQDRGRTHTCPVCRGVLREESVKPPPTETPITWPGHDLSEAVALVNGAALSAILDVESPQGWGEIQLIAGGIHKATAVHNDKTITGDEAIAVMSSWRPDIHIRSRLPSPAGELDAAGPDTGDLAERPLAAVMRYCEDFVLTCAVVAWRGNETAHVYYRRGAIERTLVNGVDDAARLPEVMAWKAGRYRILLPKLELPEAAPEAVPTEAAASTTIPGMATIPGVETPAPAPQIVAEAPQPAPAAEFSPAQLPRRPAMTIIGMPAVVVPPPTTPQPAEAAGSGRTTTPRAVVTPPPAAAPPPAATRPAASTPSSGMAATVRDAHTTIPIVTQERPSIETKRPMPIEIMDAPVSPPARVSAPAMQAAPPAAAAPQDGTPEPVTAGKQTQRGAVRVADELKDTAPARPSSVAAAAAPPAAAPVTPAPTPAVIVAPPPAVPTPAPAPAPAAVVPAPRPTPPAPAAAPKPAESRLAEPRLSEPPAPRKKSWVVPLFIVAFVAVAVAAFFIARMIWPAAPPPP
jgi:hypothetical protein